VVESLHGMGEEGMLRVEAPMRAAESRHRAFHTMVEQGVWVSQSGMDYDWSTHGFNKSVEA
jgi:hypothetical protein